MLLLACMLGSANSARAQASPLVLTDAQPSLPIWPALRMLNDPEFRRGIQDVIKVKDQFQRPSSAANTLGMQYKNVWLHVPITVSPQSDGLWVLDIDYAVLNHLELYLVDDEQVITHLQSGKLKPPAQRSIPGRAHSFALTLRPGQSYDVYLRIANEGSMILPMTWYKPATFHRSSLNEQMLQGLLTGLALCLLLYSLTQWITLRVHLYGSYALLIMGSLLFSLLHFGIGSMYLWHGSAWTEVHMGGLSALMASTGSFLFNEQALPGQDLNPMLRRLLKIGACITTTSALLYAFDAIDIHTVTAITSTVGLAPALLALPGAMAKARRGEVVGSYFLLAWLTYFVAALILIQVIKGHLEADFWTMHALQIGATLDMLIFMRVMGLYTKALHSEARHATRDRDTLHTLAHTDPLTGLPNRRRLYVVVDSAIQLAQEHEIQAVYVLDLDGFKQVNDQHGHDVGDQLLIAVAERLQAHVRTSDVVSRLGGDEFVVLACGLHSAQEAQGIGEKMVAAFDQPFTLGANVCHIGLTVGYALAPQDGGNAIELLKSADAAMYAGKKAGKHCVQRSSAVQMNISSGTEACPT